AFCPGADEAEAFDRRHPHRDVLAKPCLELCRRAQAGALRCRRGQRLDETFRRMPVNQWTPRHHVVDIAMAVGVLDVSASAAFDEQWRRADRLEGPDGAVDATWEDPRGRSEELFGG